MIRTSRWFKFEPPPDWAETTEGGRIMYRSSQSELLMVSSAAIAGHGTESEIRTARDRLLQNALSSMTSAARQPDLVITRELEMDTRISGIECWTLEAESSDQREVYLQSAFRHGMGVLFITFEGYNSPASRREYERFIKSVSGNSVDVTEG